MIKIVKLDNSYRDLLLNFCHACSELGYNNNASLELMKFNGNYDLGEHATFFATIINGEIASVSGSHSLATAQLRCGFRSASLPKYNSLIKGLSKNHMNNLVWGFLIPELILDGLKRNFDEFYITTSHTDHDASGKMHRTHRVMQLLSKRNIVEYQGIENLFFTPQTKWKFNLPEFFRSIQSFTPVLEELGTQFYEFSLNHNLIKNYL